jgi:transglutaminase-like putative cysteine protease
MRLFVHHATRYRWSEPQRGIIQLLRVTPASVTGQAVADCRIDVDRDARLRSGRDGFGNVTTMLYVDGPIDQIDVTVAGEVLIEDCGGIVAGAPEPLPPALFRRMTLLAGADQRITSFAHDLRDEGGDALDWLHRLNHRIFERIAFDTEATGVETDAGSAFARGHGVCQDHAHIFLAAARVLNIPARYVSGHLFRRDGAVAQQAGHAWVEAFVEGLGWIGFDPANGICTDDAYVRVAIGLDYGDASPTTGRRRGGGEEALDVEVRVALSQVQAQVQAQS